MKLMKNMLTQLSKHVVPVKSYPRNKSTPIFSCHSPKQKVYKYHTTNQRPSLISVTWYAYPRKYSFIT